MSPQQSDPDRSAAPSGPPSHQDRAVMATRWGHSERFVPSRVMQPLQRLLAQESAGGFALLAAAMVALVWANSPWHGGYQRLWSTPFELRLGDRGPLHLSLTLKGFVNDVLMTFFFYLAALEIKRELVHGSFRDRKAAALPALAALGGMVVPALIYVAWNRGGQASGGWGIPMATDIAFAVAVVSLLGPRMPISARAFLLTLAVADDLGGIAVIAVFYTDDLAFGWLALAALALGFSAVAQRLGVRSYAPYLALGLVSWFALHESGVHATVAGVALGLLTPANPFLAVRHFASHARPLVARVEASVEDRVLTEEEADANETGLRDLVRLSVETMSPLERHLAWAGPWVAFGIAPVFALANAGVRVVGSSLPNPLTDPVVLGPALGLLIGKPIGILIFTYLAVRSGLGRLPTGVRWPVMTGLAATAGVGFTVALFITELSFDPVSGATGLTERAKLGVLGGSVLSALLGYTLLRLAANSLPGPAATGEVPQRTNQSPGSPVGVSAHNRLA
ncbi:MAG: Na+/H+ antiporter NhaA [Acidimicrobiales bacterium]